MNGYNYATLEKELKNKPSYIMYTKLYEDIRKPLDGITDFYYMKKYWEVREKEEGKEMEAKIKYLYKYTSLTIKVLLNLIWEIESYVGVENYKENFKQEQSFDVIVWKVENYNNAWEFEI